MTRNGYDTIADLRDAPDKLHDLARWFGARSDHRSEGLIPRSMPPLPLRPEAEIEADLRRWADAIYEFLDAATGPKAHLKAYAYLAAAAIAGLIGGITGTLVIR